jgi:hypothetical protein
VAEAGPVSGSAVVDFGAGQNLVTEECTTDTGTHAVVALTIEAVSDVDVTVVGDSGAPDFGIVTRTDCPGGGLTLTCNNAFDGGTARVNRLAPGLYYVVVERPEDVLDETAEVSFAITPVVGACGDTLDNDQDALIDAEDPGCDSVLDADETDLEAPTACGDAVDNDLDGSTDFPEDADCFGLADATEDKRCPEGVTTVEVSAEGGVFTADFTQGATLGAVSCQGEAKFVVYAVTVDELSTIDVFATTPDFSTVALAVRSGCLSTDELACDNAFGEGSLRLPRVEAGTYYVLAGVNAFGGDTAEVTITVSSLIRQCNDGVDNDQDALLDIADPGCTTGMDDDEADPAEAPVCADGVDNDDDGLTDYPQDPACGAAGGGSEALSCALMPLTALLVDASGSVDTDTSVGVDNYNGASCGGGGEAPENVIGLLLTQPAAVDAVISAGNYDTVLFMRTSCDDAATELDCNDDGLEFPLSDLSFPRLEAGEYYFFVDGYSGATGTATLDITVTPL